MSRRDDFNPVADEVPFNVADLLTDSDDLTGLLDTQEVVSAIANRHFGKEFNTVYTTATLQTTSTGNVTIQTLNLTSLPTGDYIVIAYGNFLKSLIVAQIETRLFINNTTEISRHEISMDDDDYFFGDVTIAVVENISGAVDIEYQMQKINGGGNIQARNRFLAVWRVS